MSNQAAKELQSFVRRIESVEDEIKALNSDKSEIYKEARGCGYDVKVLRKVIAARRQDAAEREEQGALFELYWDAIEGVAYRVVRAHVENIEEFDAETGEITEPQVAPQPVQAGAIGISSPSVENEGAAISTPIQPETANDFGPKAGDAAPEASEANEQGGNPVGANAIHSGVTGGESAATNITPIRPAKQFRPLCLNRERCGASGPKECWKCLKAAEQGSAA